MLNGAGDGEGSEKDIPNDEREAQVEGFFVFHPVSEPKHNRAIQSDGKKKKIVIFIKELHRLSHPPVGVHEAGFVRWELGEEIRKETHKRILEQWFNGPL